MTVKLAMGQMLVEGGRVRENLQRAEGMIHDAAAQGCRVIVLPECLDLKAELRRIEATGWRNR